MLFRFKCLFCDKDAEDTVEPRPEGATIVVTAYCQHCNMGQVYITHRVLIADLNREGNTATLTLTLDELDPPEAVGFTKKPRC